MSKMNDTKDTIPHAGWATCVITPPLGVPMGGRGARFSPGEEIIDPLIAQAFVLRDGQGNTTAWISVDLIELPGNMYDQVTKQIASALGTTPPAVLINASHTHSGPMMGFDRYATLKSCPPELAAYFKTLPAKLIRLAIDAAARLTPVRVTWHLGQTDIGINRRRVVDGQTVMGPNPQGAYDSRLWVLDVQSTLDSKQRCVLLSHGCHPVMVYSFAWNAICSEWPGQARKAVQEALGDQVHCQFFQGFAGNVRPRILADMTTGKFRAATMPDVVSAGGKLAQDALTLLNEPGEPITPQLAVRQTWFIAQRDENLQPLSHWESLLDSDQEHMRECAAYWISRYQPGGIPPHQTTPWPAGILQLTPEHLIVYLGGEPVAQWREVIQQALPGRQFTSWGYTHESWGYLPTDDMIPQGGYEVSASPQLGTQSPAAFKQGVNAAAATAFKQMAVSINQPAL